MKKIRHIIVIDSVGIAFACTALREIVKSFCQGKLKKKGSGDGWDYAVTATVRRGN